MLTLVAHPALSRQPVARATHPIPVANNPALLQLARAQRVLLLQGPVGPFFDRLTDWLRDGGATVRRVAFQRGDLADCRALHPVVFQGSLREWPRFLARLIDTQDIDCIVLFGQALQITLVVVALTVAAAVALQPKCPWRRMKKPISKAEGT